jgi:hypothetical protein
MNRKAILLVGFVIASSAMADGIWDAPVKKTKPKAPVAAAPAAPAAPVAPAPEPVALAEEKTYEDCEWKFRFSPGVTVWFFDKEDNTVGPNLSFEAWRTDIPLTYRIGWELRHLDLDQEAALGSAEWPGKQTKITYVRVPFSLEYRHEMGDTTLFAGGGPDIVNAANDVSDTSVGGHLGLRLHHAFDKNWGVSVEGGYMWGELEGRDGKDIVLDGAYVNPSLAYTF